MRKLSLSEITAIKSLRQRRITKSELAEMVNISESRIAHLPDKPKNDYEHLKYSVILRGYESVQDYRNHLARERGHHNSFSYQEHLVKEKGYASLHEYREHLALKRRERPQNKKLSELIKKKLKKLRRSQSWLSRKVGVSREAISKYVQGNNYPRENVRKRIYSALEV